MTVERVPTGIPGFDELIEGGFPKASATIVTGIPGCAKTTFAMQFIVNGALRFNDRGIYITVEEGIETLSRTFSGFGYDLKKLQNDGKIDIISLKVKPEMGEDFLERIISDKFLERVGGFGAKRVAIDPLNLIIQFSSDMGGERRSIQRLIDSYKNLGCTLLMTHERTKQSEELEFQVVDFVVDGIIYLQMIKSIGAFSDSRTYFERRLSILKMRETNHAQGIYRFDIEKDGIHVYHDILLRKGV